jgi:hypothetical protein
VAVHKVLLASQNGWSWAHGSDNHSITSLYILGHGRAMYVWPCHWLVTTWWPSLRCILAMVGPCMYVWAWLVTTWWACTVCECTPVVAKVVVAGIVTTSNDGTQQGDRAAVARSAAAVPMPSPRGRSQETEALAFLHELGSLHCFASVCSAANRKLEAIASC